MRTESAAGAGIGLCLVLAGGASAVSPSPVPSLATIGQPADDGARIVRVDTLDARTRDLTVESPAVGIVGVRLLLPEQVGARPENRFPVLYLLHGAGGEYVDWTEETDVEALTATTDLLIVMPAAAASDLDGWYTDRDNGGAGGPPMWETFHLVELRQLLERNWQAGDTRAVAGLSLGGYGAVTYAANHPDLFRAAASYSGVLDVTAYLEHVPDPDATARWGDPAVDPAAWAAINPVSLVPQLEGTHLYLAYGTGEPGPLDPAGTEHDELEAWVAEGSDHFVAALDQAGITAVVNAYGPGTHSWPYWERELHASLPMLLEVLGGATPAASASSAP